MATMNAGRAVVEVLKAEGVKFMFGIPGGHTLNIYDALYDTPEIRHILVRHEQIAANMAVAYAQLTGEPGICSATAGPGATNMLTGIAEAFIGAQPVIALTGRAETRDTFRGASQEVPQDKIFAPVTKWAVRVDRADLVVEVLRQAFTIARSGKPGPVLIDLPWDIMRQSVEFSGYVPVGKPPAPRADAARIKAVTERLLRASRPIIIAGGGTVASGAFVELRELAETLGTPVLTTLSGRGSLPDDHPLAAGGLGIHRNRASKQLLAEADFVLGLGCRFESMETNWLPGYVPAPNACYVQVDVDPAELGRSVVPEIGVVGDIQLVLQDLIAAARESGAPDHRTTFRTLPRVVELARQKVEMEAELERATAGNESPLSPIKVVREVRAAFPPETTTAIDAATAQTIAGAFPHYKIYEPRSCAVTTSLYTMGYGSSALPVAKLVYPDRPAVGFTTDGSFGMVMNVLPTAAEHRLPVTWIVLDNSKLGVIDLMQKRVFQGRTIASNFEVQLDFALIAKACGCYGERVDDPRQIRAALGRAIEANNRGVPAVLDFIIGEEEAFGVKDQIAARQAAK